jgi:hypothetical protein
MILAQFAYYMTKFAFQQAQLRPRLSYLEAVECGYVLFEEGLADSHGSIK